MPQLQDRETGSPGANADLTRMENGFMYRDYMYAYVTG